MLPLIALYSPFSGTKYTSMDQAATHAMTTAASAQSFFHILSTLSLACSVESTAKSIPRMINDFVESKVCDFRSNS